MPDSIQTPCILNNGYNWIKVSFLKFAKSILNDRDMYSYNDPIINDVRQRGKFRVTFVITVRVSHSSIPCMQRLLKSINPLISRLYDHHFFWFTYLPSTKGNNYNIFLIIFSEWFYYYMSLNKPLYLSQVKQVYPLTSISKIYFKNPPAQIPKEKPFILQGNIQNYKSE